MKKKKNRNSGIPLMAAVTALLLTAMMPVPQVRADWVMTVTTGTDEAVSPGTGCSLREAVTNFQDGALTYPECGGTADTAVTVNVPAGTYNLTGAEIEIRRNASLTVQGEGAGSTIIDRGLSSGRIIINVMGSTALTLNDLTLTRGRGSDGGAVYNRGMLTVNNCIFSGNSTNADGGAICNDGTCTVNSSTFSGNSTSSINGRGGGMFNDGTCTVSNSTFSGNSVTGAGGGGGGMFNNGMCTVSNSTFSGNSETSINGGGGICNNGTCTVNSSTFSGNSGNGGGGICNFGGTCRVSNSTFSGNSATGGGIYNFSGTCTISNSTFSENSATTFGGGIFNQSIGTLILKNNILANSASGGDCVNWGGTVSSAVSNLIESTGTNACGLTNGTDGNIIGSDPLLSALADNGGTTQTMALQAGSPAINAGDSASCLTTDQRGNARVGVCDIGAFEYGAVLPAPSLLNAAAVSQTQINLSWTDNSSDETGFKIYRGSTLVTTTAADATSYNDTGLTCNTAYTYTVIATNAVGDSAATSPANATTQACGATTTTTIPATTTTTTLPPPSGLPDAPSGLTAQPVSHEAIYLTWTDNSDNETGFIIERWSMGAAWTTVGVVGADVTSYTDSPLSYSWEYHYRIRAYNASGNSDYSNETSAWTWFHPYETCKGITLNGSEAVRGSASVQENAPAGTVIGTFGTVSPTGAQRYELFPDHVPGIDNGFFVIDGNVLKTGGDAKPDYEEKKELRISLLSIDTATPYAWCHAEFVIAVTDVPEAPTFLHLSDYGGSVPENQPGSFVANIVTEDDPGDTHTYSLVSGEGDTDNALFRIEGNTLKTGSGVDYETKQNVSVRIRTTDQTSAYFERFILLTVRNTPDPPVLSDIANVNTDDDFAVSVKFTVSDQDTALSYLTVSAKSDNAAVLPAANIAVSGTGADRTVTLTPVKGKAGSAKITVTVADGDFTVEKSFTLTVTTGPGLRAVTRIEGGTDGTLVAGDTLKYSASITNDGDRDVSGVVFTVPLPEGTEYEDSGKRSDSGIIYDSESNEVEWTGDVPAGETVEFGFDVRVTSGGSIVFSDAEISYDSDGDGVNDTLRKADNDAGMTALFAEDCRPGDIDADGEITLRDAVMVLQTLSGSDAEVCTDADVNDGQIGAAEAVFILNELAK